MHSLRHAWTALIEAADYEAHMAAIGQAQANTSLVAELLDRTPPATEARVWIAGAGTGQMFDFISPALFLPFHTTFSDLNALFLGVVAARLELFPGLRYEMVIDDVEDSRLAGGYDLAMAVLVLEHVDWRRAIACLCRRAARVYCVIQENPPSLDTALATSRVPVGTMNVLSQVHPQLLERSTLEREFQNHRFTLRRVSSRDVADGKRMIGLDFQRLPEVTTPPTGFSVP